MAVVELDFYPLCGLFDEFYYPCKNDLVITPLKDASELYRANGLFWGRLLSHQSINDAIQLLHYKYEYRKCEDVKYAAILANPSLFLKRIDMAIDEIVDQSTPEPVFFGAVEALSILCRLYSEFVFSPNALTVADGFVVDEYSSQMLMENCLLPTKNPYLSFLTSECFPAIEKTKATIAWIHGPLRISTMSMACKVRENNPNIHIAIVDHSSEYYSMTKIVRFLKQNTMLFKVIDSIILEDDKETKEMLKTAIQKGRSLLSVPNLLFMDKKSNTIHQTSMSGECNLSFANNLNYRSPSALNRGDRIDPSSVVSGKLAPNRICPWRKCSFCGINTKYYRKEVPDEVIESKIKKIRALAEQGVRYFWFFDEAATPELLSEFAKALIDNKLDIIWHCRSRIDPEYDEDLCALLARSGLREIRFGLESASAEIQKKMNKFDSFDILMVEKLVEHFSNVGVGIHFPVIIGMPEETYSQRQETYRFLRHLKNTYSGFTFNINILELDVSSKLYLNFEQYGITGLKLPCTPLHFLGNVVETWADSNGWFDKRPLVQEQNKIMREIMFPWMPQDAITPPNIHYRLTETIRNTLIWKAGNTRKLPSSAVPLTNQTTLVLSPWVVIVKVDFESPDALTTLYDLRYNQSVSVDALVYRIIKLFTEPCRVDYAIEEALLLDALPVDSRSEIESFISVMYEKFFLWKPQWLTLTE